MSLAPTDSASPDLQTQLDDRGFIAVREVVTHPQCLEAIAALPAERSPATGRSGVAGSGRASAGIRTLLSRPTFCDLARELRSSPALHALLSDLVAVQCTLFAKTQDSNWSVQMHRDEVLPIEGTIVPTHRERGNADRWHAASHKDGEQYARAPLGVLQQCCAVRVLLDDAPEGDLRVLPGSHRNEAASTGQHTPHSVGLARGDVFCMRPLLRHGSAKLRTTLSRRVLHFVFAPRVPTTGGNPSRYTWKHAV